MRDEDGVMCGTKVLTVDPNRENQCRDWEREINRWRERRKVGRQGGK